MSHPKIDPNETADSAFLVRHKVALDIMVGFCANPAFNEMGKRALSAMAIQHADAWMEVINAEPKGGKS